MAISDVCRGQADIVPKVTDGNIDHAHDIINHFTIAFSLDKLKDEQIAHKALLPNPVNFPSIACTTTMK